jgi:hypothetical protein
VAEVSRGARLFFSSALQAITGKSVSSPSITQSSLAAAWQSGQLIVLGTPPLAAGTPTPSINGVNIAGNHVYAVVGYNSSTQTFTLFNPWGVNGGIDPQTGAFCAGTVTGTATQLATVFSYAETDSGAAPLAGNLSNSSRPTAGVNPGGDSVGAGSAVRGTIGQGQSQVPMQQLSLPPTEVAPAHYSDAVFATLGGQSYESLMVLPQSVAGQGGNDAGEGDLQCTPGRRAFWEGV